MPSASIKRVSHWTPISPESIFSFTTRAMVGNWFWIPNRKPALTITSTWRGSRGLQIPTSNSCAAAARSGAGFWIFLECNVCRDIENPCVPTNGRCGQGILYSRTTVPAARSKLLIHRLLKPARRSSLPEKIWSKCSLRLRAQPAWKSAGTPTPWIYPICRVEGFPSLVHLPNRERRKPVFAKQSSDLIATN